jgi:hypothetical protein
MSTNRKNTNVWGIPSMEIYLTSLSFNGIYKVAVAEIPLSFNGINKVAVAG